MQWCDVSKDLSYPHLLCNPMGFAADPHDENSETLAVDRNGPLPRVGSVASVETTTSSIAIQVL
jgi:hypothetical protein